MKKENGVLADDRDIAVIGLSLRLPGSRTPEEFWSHLAEGRSLISEVPERRWRKEDHLGHPRREFNKTNSVWGGFVDDADCFDADFFQISPREAQSMDPQQRMALELSWHALEDAGYRADRVAGSRTGVFMGVCHWDYAELIEQEVEEIDAYYPTGAAYAIIANRVSHHFDFRGPSVVNDTACAASLVAVQQAVQALQAGDCDLALAGGVNLTWSPRHFIAFAKAGMLSPDGRCRAFDADANGYVRGEGGGVILLKRAADARRDGDAVHAVIKGIGSNHGGRTSSLTVTNPAAQAELIAGVYRKAGIAPETVTYVETHGPGTPVGDPIEIRGLKQAFADLGTDRTAEAPAHRCGIGSVKTNIGHLEGAAGIAGMLKVILAMRHRKLPATVNFRKLNPLINLDGSPLYVLDRLTDWDTEGSAPLRAGVSSFGFGGTNAHVLLEAADPVAATEDEGEQWLPVSAKDEERLRETCARLARWVRTRIEQNELPALTDVARTLREGRVPLRERVVFRASGIEEWAAQLESVAAGEEPPAHCPRGRAGTEAPDGLDADDLTALAERWLEKGRQDKFAAAWAQGLPVDWEQWPEHGRRVHVPGYAFASTPHWFRTDRDETTGKPERGVTPTAPAPLGEGEPEGGDWTFPLRFDASQGFVRDHLVNGARIVPGVVALALVTEAAGRAAAADARAGLAPRIRNAVWIRPLLVGDTGLTAQLRLTPAADGYDYAITDDHGTQYTSGRVEYGEPAAAERTDPSALRERFPQRVDAAEGYAALRSSGIEHGPALRGLHALHRGPDGVLAELRLPAGVPDGMALQPAILDSALLACLALGPADGGWRRPAAPAVPFALDRLTVHAATTPTMWAWLRPAGSGTAGGTTGADIDLFDENGRLCVRFSGYTSRELPTARPAAAQAPEGELLELTGVWEADPAPAPAAGQATPAGPVTVLNAALDDDLAAASAARLGVDIRQLAVPAAAADVTDAEAMKAAFAACYPQVRQLVGQGRQVLVVAPGAPDSPVYVPLAALLKTAQQENPSFRGRLVLLDAYDPRDADRFERVVRAEAGAGDDTEAAYDAQDRRVRHGFVELPRNEEGESLLRDRGVYWITGGAGGLGLLLAERLCHRHRAVVVVSGRAAHSRAVEALRARLPHGEVAYCRTDVTDADAVRDTVAEIRAQHGRLDGVFHAAGVLDDGYLANKPLAGTAAVLAPKVDGATYIDDATRAHGLDFLLLFGSVAGAFGNAAQADYAAANAFLDAFAARRQAAGSVTRSVDWPLWADGGMRVDDASLAYLRKRTGTVPLPSEAGLDALERALRSDAPVRRVVLFGERSKLLVYAGLDRAAKPERRASGVQRDTAAPAVLEESELVARTQDLLRNLFAEVTRQDAEHILVEEKLETYGIESISIVDLTSRLEDTFGSLPKTLFFEHVDLRGVAGYFVAEHRERLLELFAPEAPAPQAPAPEALAPEQPALQAPAVQKVPAAAPAPAVRPSGPDRHDIAVIGMAGRYPGADTLEEFWELLSEGRHSFEPVPESRWRHSDIYFDERDVDGKTVVKTGTFLRDVAAFDPRYFNISQRDAELLSPEVRLFLQAGVVALEDAGYSRETLRRRYDGDVGVLVGSMNNSYSLYGFQNMLMRGTATSGSELGVMANMLSYHYGFTGPSVFLDTMCSSASACVHQAVRMLRGGECRMAVVGGINLMLHPFDLIATSQAHFTTKSADVVRSYGLGADGTILGEGVGTLVLKPLAEAVADGDHVYGVIKGSGMTNAGVRNGFTVPSPQQQARAIEKALDDAAVDARTISYLEGHGSATSLGDPIEIKGAALAFGRDTQDLGFCALGSVKSNVAHLLSGSGMAGLTKVLLQLKHRTLAPSLHAGTLSSAIDFDKTPFVVQRHRDTWRRPVVGGEEVPRRAGVTSIGAGGINVHIVVEEHDGQVAAAPDSGRPQLLVFSAMTPQALQKVLRDVHECIAETAPGLDSLAYTLQTGKNELPCRLAFVADDIAVAQARLARLSAVDWTAPSPGVPAGVHFTASTLRRRRTADAATVEQALYEGELADLAQHWTDGASLDWDRLWPSGSRPAKPSLPAYPFDKVHCWYPEHDDAPSVLRPLAFAGRAHPWVGVNASDLNGVRYTLRLRGDELLDYVHTVGRKRRYATVALLDAALAFARLAGLAGPLRLRNAQWAALPSPSDAPETFTWRLGASGDGVHRVELWHADEATLRFAAEVVPSAPAEDASMPQVMKAPATLDGDSFYAALGTAGLDARPYARSVEGVTELDDHRLLVRVAEPAMCQDPHKQQVHLPAWALAGLLQGVQHTLGRADAAVVRVGSVQGEQWERTRAIVLARMSDAVFIAAFLDEDGRVLGRVEDAEFTAGDLPPALPGEAGRALVALPQASRPVLQAPAGTEERQQPEAEPTVPVPVAVDRLAAADEPVVADETEALVVASLRETVADLLKFDLADIDLDTHFHAYGFESIALAKMASELNGILGTDLTPAVFFECPDIRSLAEHLLDRYGPELTLPTVTGAPVPVAATRPSPEPAPEPGPDDGAVAIVGAAGRFPGADDLDTFWQQLRAGEDLITDYPGDRFDGPYADVVARADFPKFAGRIDGVDRFDADFFHLSRLEAELMDPQHRLALETVWDALENGGYAPARLPANTGVYFGVSGSDYHHLLNASGVAPDGYTATGNAHSMLANRISYVLDVNGPSEPVDTACSSSLVALHRAVESIRSGRCDMAIAGGVNLLLSVDTFAATHMAGMLSPDGRCKTFSAGADGYVRSEGVAAVLLKPLARAQRDGDAIWGVIRGTAENHGGRAGSLTAPNGKAQAALIQEAMRGTDPDSVGYVEAHGTGTGLGDPVEVNALDSAYRALRTAEGRPPHAARPCALGSVKSNIGHAEAAAGLAGVLKVLLAMRHRELPPTLHCDRLNPHLPLDGGFEVVRTLRRWEPCADATGGSWPLRAGVSSFGFGGANAHVVLEAPPVPPAPAEPARTTASQAIVLSARDGERLRATAGRLRDFLDRARRDGHAPDLADLAFTLQVGREAMEQRLGFVAGSIGDVLGTLDRFLAGDGPSTWHTGGIRRSRGTGVRREPEQAPEVTRALRDGQLDRVTALWCDGAPVDWQAIHPAGERRTVQLPAQPFARDRYWVPAGDGAPVPPPAAPAPPPAAEPAFETDARAELLRAVLDGRADPDALSRT
ncbi:SDR family NAD(P)-dependent oxidoreductase [Streptomyces sp. G7(2002)]|uniref:SDR family NAD(P)-dependent oxidoreductase n=1 Tax=Streptomyces sp. G7(2002) TaxID=2971798 RepID=UPI00237E9575|nr:SDR family NAD(P)-dependent oxidoreductase [Streptomyces sp. G7(2002)]WDT53170.1 SDR family NAD(P)-dependent oxidoreductase [Streptomyces sp. G7(2002)]